MRMNIVILNGSPDLFQKDFERQLEIYRVMLHHLGYYIRIFQLSQIMNEEKRDLSALTYVSRAIDESDIVLFASPYINHKVTELIHKTHQALSVLQEDKERKILEMSARPVLAVITIGADCDQVVMPENLNFNTHAGHIMIQSRTHTEAVFETIKRFKTQTAVSEYAS